MMKRMLIASFGIAAILGVGEAQAGHGVVTATHAGLNCYEFQLAGSPDWYGIPMIGTGYAMQAAEIASARDTGKVIGFSLSGNNCSASSPNGAGVVPVPQVWNVNIPPLSGQ
jgi:hypothetical protein